MHSGVAGVPKFTNEGAFCLTSRLLENFVPFALYQLELSHDVFFENVYGLATQGVVWTNVRDGCQQPLISVDRFHLALNIGIQAFFEEIQSSIDSFIVADRHRYKV